MGNTGPIHLALLGLTVAGRLADKIWVDFEILKILNKLNYLDLYFVNIYAILLSAESAFQSFFLK